MFGSLGGPEIFLILVIALIVFGPRKLPEIGKSMGKMLAEFRKASTDFQRTIHDEVEADRARETQATATPVVAAAVAVPVTEVPLTAAHPETLVAQPEAATPEPSGPRIAQPDAPIVSRGSAEPPSSEPE
jgi:TatA/E family protein of Tat protein translocase